MTVKINGGIISEQTLTGSLRYFKMTGPFAWTVSDGSVNLPVFDGSSSYFVVGTGRPVPNSAAEIALSELSKKCTFAIISPQPSLAGGTTAIHFACPASAFGWGSDTPAYDVPPANTGEDLTAAATQMTAAVVALGNKTVYVSVGAANQSAVPVTAVANLATVVITEVPFALA